MPLRFFLTLALLINATTVWCGKLCALPEAREARAAAPEAHGCCKAPVQRSCCEPESPDPAETPPPDCPCLTALVQHIDPNSAAKAPAMPVVRAEPCFWIVETRPDRVSPLRDEDARARLVAPPRERLCVWNE